MVKSYGERLIADFFYLNGVDYFYERPYDVSDSTHAQYCPDFYYPASTSSMSTGTGPRRQASAGVCGIRRGHGVEARHARPARDDARGVPVGGRHVR